MPRRCAETVGLVAPRRRCGEQPPRPPPRLEDALALGRSLPLLVLRATFTLGESLQRLFVRWSYGFVSVVCVLLLLVYYDFDSF